jgi:hypothetical protein
VFIEKNNAGIQAVEDVAGVLAKRSVAGAAAP